MKIGDKVKTTLGTGEILAFENKTVSDFSTILEFQDRFNESATIRVVVELDCPENWIFYPEQQNPHFFLNELTVIN